MQKQLVTFTLDNRNEGIDRIIVLDPNTGFVFEGRDKNTLLHTPSGAFILKTTLNQSVEHYEQSQEVKKK